MVKRLLVIAGVLTLLLAGVVALLPQLLRTSALQVYVIQTAAKSLGRPVRFESFSISVLPRPAVRFRRLEVAEDPAFGAGPFLTVGEGRLGIRLRPLLTGRIELGDLTLDRPRVDLVADGRGRWNWASLGAPTPSAGGLPRTLTRAANPVAGALLLSHVRISGGTVRYRTPDLAGREITLDRIDAAITRAPSGGALRVTGTAVAQPGDVEIAFRDVSVTPASGHAASEAALRGKIDLVARDVGALAAAFAAPAGAAGQLRGRLDISGTLGHATAQGALGFDRLALSGDLARCEPPHRQLSLDAGRIPISYSASALDAAPLELEVARGAVSVDVGVTLGPAKLIALREIKIRGVELEPILVDFLCRPSALTGPLDLTGSATLRSGDAARSLSGAGRVRVGPGKVVGRDVAALLDQVMDLTSAVSSGLDADRRARPSPAIDFNSITASYTVRNGVVRTEDLVLETPDARVKGAGTIALSDGRLHLEVVMTQGANEVRGVIAGTAEAPTVTPTAIRVSDSRGIRRFVEKLLR